MINTKKGKLLIAVGSLLISINSYAQLDVLQSVQESRITAKKQLKAEDYESAYSSMNEFIDNAPLVNPFDNLNYALCSFKRGDTVTFLKYLDKSIAGGVDSLYYNGYLKKITGKDRAYLNNYTRTNYVRIRKAGRAKYDTALINEVNSIAKIDHYLQDELTRIKAITKKDDTTLNYLTLMATQADSINCQRIMALLETDRFPGYHNCGGFTSVLQILIRLGDNEDQWQYIYARLKKEVLTGNVSPDEVASIVDNHYQRREDEPCSYYGHSWAGKTKDICDCEKVDKNRAAIGLETLKEEYELKDTPLPDCYTAGGAHNTMSKPVKH